MKILITLFLSFWLAGCVTAPVVKKIGQVNDDTLTAAETIICQGASVGSVIRKYGQDEAKAKAWRELCLDTNEGHIVQPEAK